MTADDFTSLDMSTKRPRFSAARFSRLLASLSAVHVLTIADLRNDNELIAIIDGIHDSITTLSNSVAVLLACELFGSRRAARVNEIETPRSNNLVSFVL